jgi:hypothetical protein
VVVKVDDGIHSRPQTGLGAADVVVEEEVEGVTRLAAAFHSALPETVGNVRSARSSDVDIVAALSTPLFAWSGGNPGVTQEVLAAARDGLLTNASYDVATPAYFRADDRPAPYNLYVHPAQLLERAPQGQGPPAPLFTYRAEGQALPASALPALGVSIPFTRTTLVSYAWDAERQAWDRFQVDGEHGPAESAFVDADGTQVAPANVVVLLTPYGTSPADSRSPMALTVGEGDAYVFTSGAMIAGRWARADASQAPELLDAQGQPIALTPGRTWVELPRVGAAVAAIDEATADGLLAVRR